jgi:mannitol-1-phosphate 5-dehydrogenase
VKAVIIGGGRIGCGFAGEMFAASGYEVIFVARSCEFVDHINRVGRYRVRITSKRKIHDVNVRNVRAVCTENAAAVDRALATADVIGVSVGSENLAGIAPMLARGLAQRSSAVSVLAFENMMNAGDALREHVRQHISPEFPLDLIGFSGALVMRAVTQRVGDLDGNMPITFLADSPEEFTVSASALRGPQLKLRGMIEDEDFAAAVMRKLYVFSAGHATTAYLGALKGYHYIHSAIGDPEIRSTVIEAMREGQIGLAAHFKSSSEGAEAEIATIIDRFENANLCDPLTRVGRDPVRKLHSNERLIGAARLASAAGVPPAKLGLAAAAAVCFYNPADPKCNQLQQYVKNVGIDVTLCDLCGLASDDGVRQCVAEKWRELSSGWRRGNMLLSLDNLQWAWS